MSGSLSFGFCCSGSRPGHWSQVGSPPWREDRPAPLAGLASTWKTPGRWALSQVPPPPSHLWPLASQALSPLPPVSVIQPVWTEQEKPLHFWYVPAAGSFVDFPEIFHSNVVAPSRYNLLASTMALRAQGQQVTLTLKGRHLLHGRAEGLGSPLSTH